MAKKPSSGCLIILCALKKFRAEPILTQIYIRTHPALYPTSRARTAQLPRGNFSPPPSAFRVIRRAPPAGGHRTAMDESSVARASNSASSDGGSTAPRAAANAMVPPAPRRPTWPIIGQPVKCRSFSCPKTQKPVPYNGKMVPYYTSAIRDALT